MAGLLRGNKTFGEILDANRGAGPGFDLLRIGLAVTILASHASHLAGNHGALSALLKSIFHLHQQIGPAVSAAAPVAVGGEPPGEAVVGLGRPYTLSHVPMFFALSGFLVTGSALRTRNVFRFLGLRGLRIFPALLVELALSAFVLGAIFTTVPLKDYFSSAGFWSYFENLIGIVHFYLPGVFEHFTPSSKVNANLWTLPSEFDCYWIAAVLMVVGVMFNRVIFTWLLGIATVGLLIANSFFGFQVTNEILPGPVITYYFMVGVAFHLWRDKIPYSPAMFVVSVVVSSVLMMFTNTVYLYPALLTYVTVFIGLSPLPQFKLLKSGDYSYGVYLYGYPITQALIAAIPAIRGNFLLILASSLVVTFLFAAFSWHAIEKNVLKLKKYLSPKSAAISESLHPGATGVVEAEAMVAEPKQG